MDGDFGGPPAKSPRLLEPQIEVNEDSQPIELPPDNENVSGQAREEDLVTWVETKRNKDKALNQNRAYTLDKLSGSDPSVAFYKCFKKCGARVHIKNGYIIKRVGFHTCPLDTGLEEALQIDQEIKDESNSLDKSSSDLVYQKYKTASELLINVELNYLARPKPPKWQTP